MKKGFFENAKRLMKNPIGEIRRTVQSPESPSATENEAVEGKQEPLGRTAEELRAEAERYHDEEGRRERARVAATQEAQRQRNILRAEQLRKQAYELAAQTGRADAESSSPERDLIFLEGQLAQAKQAYERLMRQGEGWSHEAQTKKELIDQLEEKIARVQSEQNQEERAA